MLAGPNPHVPDQGCSADLQIHCVHIGASCETCRPPSYRAMLSLRTNFGAGWLQTLLPSCRLFPQDHYMLLQ